MRGAIYSSISERIHYKGNIGRILAVDDVFELRWIWMSWFIAENFNVMFRIYYCYIKVFLYNLKISYTLSHIMSLLEWCNKDTQNWCRIIKLIWHDMQYFIKHFQLLNENRSTDSIAKIPHYKNWFENNTSALYWIKIETTETQNFDELNKSYLGRLFPAHRRR